MLQQSVPMFGTALNERDAFRAIFSFGGTLSGLDPNAVGNVPAALNNARQFTAETIAMLKRSSSRQPNGRRRWHDVRNTAKHLQRRRPISIST